MGRFQGGRVIAPPLSVPIALVLQQPYRAGYRGQHGRKREIKEMRALKGDDFEIHAPKRRPERQGYRNTRQEREFFHLPIGFVRLQTPHQFNRCSDLTSIKRNALANSLAMIEKIPQFPLQIIFRLTKILQLLGYRRKKTNGKVDLVELILRLE